MAVLFDLHRPRMYNKSRLAAILVSGLLIVFILLYTQDGYRKKAWEAEGGKVLVIDAGHGGIDGGAIASDGTRESGINLAIALKMQALAELFGQCNIMTRTQDVSLSDPRQYSEHEDLVFRAGIASDTPGAILVSIHQNFYISSQPSGAQTLYANDRESESLGKLMHENLHRYLQPENRRLAEPAPKKLFLTSNASCPAVLVECGFMSNPEDLAKLKSGDYQTELAAVLLISFLEYTNDYHT